MSSDEGSSSGSEDDWEGGAGGGGLGFKQRRRGGGAKSGGAKRKMPMFMSSGILLPGQKAAVVDSSDSSGDDDKGKRAKKKEGDTAFDELVGGLGSSPSAYVSTSDGLGSANSAAPSLSSAGLGSSSSSSSSNNSRSGGIGSSNADFRKAFVKSAPTNGDAEPKKKPMNIDPSLGKWERHTKGFGMAMLKKMGFSGRLGLHEDGISKAVELDFVPVAGKSHGLGFGQKAKPEEELAGKEKQPRSALTNKAKPTGKPRKPEKKRSRVVFFGDDVGGGGGDGGGQAAVERIDMRGPDGGKKRGVFGQELLYNLEAMRDAAQMELERTRSREADHTRRREALQADIGRAECAQKSYMRVASSQRSLHAALVELEARRSDARLDTAWLSQTFATLYSSFPNEFGAFGLWDVLGQLAGPVVVADLKPWLVEPFENPGVLLQHFQLWGGMLRAIDSRGDPKAATHIYALYDAACMTELRRRILNDWEVDECELGLRLIGCVKLAISSEAFDALCKTVLVPKLLRAVSAYSASSYNTHTAHMHIWLLPWRDVIGTCFDDLLPEVKHRLAQTLGKVVEKSKSSALAALRPWVGVLSKKDTDSLVAKVVLPSLASKMRQLRYDDEDAAGEGAELAPLASILAFAPVIPGALLDALLQGEFFPLFIQRLCAVYSQSGPMAAGTFYRKWRGSFSEAVAGRRRVYLGFHVAVQALAGLLGPAESAEAMTANLLRQPLLPLSSYKDALAAIRKDDSAEKAVHKERATPSAALTFKDIVGKVAGKHDLPFYPERGPPHSKAPNQQVWRLGTSLCCIDKDVLFLLQGGSFRPVALEALAALDT